MYPTNHLLASKFGHRMQETSRANKNSSTADVGYVGGRIQEKRVCCSLTSTHNMLQLKNRCDPSMPTLSVLGRLTYHSSRQGPSCHIFTLGFSAKDSSDFLKVPWEGGSVEQRHVQVTMKGLYLL